MAFVNTTRVAHVGLADRFAAIVKAVKEDLNRRRVYKQTLAELNALSSRELADLGLHRSMLTRVALEAAYGK